MVKAGTFRDDLYFRMSAAAIFIPPLRERREAIPAFIGYFIEQYNRLFSKNVSEISRAAIDLLCAYQWPGNVRELSNAIESAVILSENNRIVVSDLPEQIVDGTGAELLSSPGEPPANGHEPARGRASRAAHRFRLGAAGIPARRRDQENLGALARRDRGQSPPRRRLARRLPLDALPDADPLRHRRKSPPPLNPANVSAVPPIHLRCWQTQCRFDNNSVSMRTCARLFAAIAALAILVRRPPGDRRFAAAGTGRDWNGRCRSSWPTCATAAPPIPPSASSSSTRVRFEQKGEAAIKSGDYKSAEDRPVAKARDILRHLRDSSD